MSDANGSNAPKRAVRLTIEVQADDRAEMVNALENIALRIDRGEFSGGVSGGCGSGWVADYREDAGPTHDEYFRSVEEWLKREKA